MPFTSSVVMLEVATAEPQPKVWNVMSSMRSSRTRMYISMRSPQTGLPTRPTATSSPSSTPTLRGLRKWSSVFSEYCVDFTASLLVRSS